MEVRKGGIRGSLVLGTNVGSRVRIVYYYVIIFVVGSIEVRRVATDNAGDFHF